MNVSVTLPESFLLVFKEPELALKELVDSTLALQSCNRTQENSFGKSIKKPSVPGTSKQLTV